MSDNELPRVIETIPYVHDVVLQVFADFSRQSEDSNLSMTVIAGGKLITGEVLHRNAWLAKLQDVMPHDEARQMIETIELALRQYDAEQDANLVQGEDEPVRAGWLNFDQAEVDGVAVGLLRVALSSVTAWTLGYRR